MIGYKCKEVYDSFLIGKMDKMVKQIDDYGRDFWKNYLDCLETLQKEKRLNINPHIVFSCTVIAYHKIKDNS